MDYASVSSSMPVNLNAVILAATVASIFPFAWSLVPGTTEVLMLGREGPTGCVPEGGSARSTALRLLRTLGANTVRHLNGNLLNHLKRTERLLLDWEASEELALAGLCHAVYGTDGFVPALLRLDERQRLSIAVGTDVEAVVYLYASCDRGYLYPQIGSVSTTRSRDRFTNHVATMSEKQLRAFVDLTLANEADVAMFGNSSATVPPWFTSLVDQFGPMASLPVAGACQRLVESARSLRQTPSHSLITGVSVPRPDSPR
jgi:hypothetical protein